MTPEFNVVEGAGSRRDKFNEAIAPYLRRRVNEYLAEGGRGALEDKLEGFARRLLWDLTEPQIDTPEWRLHSLVRFTHARRSEDRVAVGRMRYLNRKVPQ